MHRRPRTAALRVRRAPRAGGRRGRAASRRAPAPAAARAWRIRCHRARPVRASGERGRSRRPTLAGVRRTLAAVRAPAPTSLPWWRPRHEVLLLALVAVVAFLPAYRVGDQDLSRFCLTQALVHGHISNDRCLAPSFDKAIYG